MRVAVIAVCLFAVGLAAILLSGLQQPPEARDLPWLDVDCRPLMARSGDRGMATVVEFDGMSMLVWVVHPLRMQQSEGHTFRFGDDEQLTFVEVDWADLDVASSGPAYGGLRSMKLSDLQQRTRGLRVNMRAAIPCHDPDAMWQSMARFIERQRLEGAPTSR